jgi:hypothetical protein
MVEEAVEEVGVRLILECVVINYVQKFLVEDPHGKKGMNR